MNMTGIAGIFLGAPVGATAGGLLGFSVGAILDRLSGSKLSTARLKRLGIAVAIGAGLGLPLSLSAQSSLAMIVGAWLGCLCGCLWNTVFAKSPPEDGMDASHRPHDDSAHKND